MPETTSRDHAGFVVAGLGKMGIMHAAMLGVIPGGRVAALVDRDERHAEHVRSMGIDAPVFGDLAACLDALRPEGVFITTPTFTHRPLFELCLTREIPAFCEKPLAPTLADALAMVQAARARPQLPVAVGFMLGHNPLFRKAADLLRRGVPGRIRSFRAVCRLSQVFSPKKGWTFTREQAGGGVLINSGCHLLFVLDLLFGPPRSVFARASGVHNPVEDTLAALLEYPDGLWGTVEVTWSVPGHELQCHDIEVIGTQGTLEVGNDVLRLWLSQKHEEYPAGWSLWPRAALEPRAPFNLSPDYCGDEFYLEVRDFVDAVRRQRPPRVGLDDALRVQTLIDAIYRSAEQRAPVSLAPPREAAHDAD